jgi:non-ribosomal peptide synthetase-like protein
MSANAFRLCHTRIGDRCYLGNNIHYPPDGKTGENVLLGTKAAIPIDGPVRENVGLLGSPAFEIPRMVDRDRDFNAQMSETTRQQRLHDKNLHNFNTIILYLLAGLVVSFVSLYLGYVAILAYPVYGVAAFAAIGIVLTIFTVLFFAFCERATLLFRRLRPKTVSIYDKAFWQHERHWKFCETPIQRMFRGTPLKNVVSRLMGVRVGRRVFDDGAQFTERTLVEIGDYCTLNPGVTIQAHSLEEGVFKSEHIRIGKGATLGPNAFIHYGVTMDDNVLIETDCFLMKGEAPAAHSTWQGNPARAVRKAPSAISTTETSKNRPAMRIEKELAATA